MKLISLFCLRKLAVKVEIEFFAATSVIIVTITKLFDMNLLLDAFGADEFEHVVEQVL